MAQIGLLVTELKRYLKAQGVTYASLAKQLDLSESSVKRQFARQSFSLARLEQILNLVGLEIADLIALMNERRVRFCRSLILATLSNSAALAP